MRKIGAALDRAMGWAGMLLFLGCGLRWFMQYGTRWEFGPTDLPRAALFPGTTRYRDDTVPDPLNLALIRSGSEDQPWLIVLGILAILVVWCGREAYRLGCMIERDRS